MLKTKISRTATIAALALMAGLSSPASAQFSLDRLVSDAVNVAVSGVADAVKGVVQPQASEAQDHSVNKRPAGWPAGATWYAYTETAPQPVANGTVRKFKQPGYADSIDFKSLPLQHAIVRVHGNGERKIAMFADPTCPYTKKMEQALNKMNNVTIYTFVVPSLGEKSRPRAESIVCQASNQARAQAYDNWILNGKVPPVVASCDNAIDKVMSSLRGVRDSSGDFYSQISPVAVIDTNIVTTGGLDARNLKAAFDWK